jgi:hypothetical protein
MKKATFTLITMSILFLFFFGCSGGSSSGSDNSDGGDRVAAENLQPVAIGGDDQTVFVGDAASLDGSGSYDPDNNYPLTYDWQVVSKPEGSAAILSVNVSAEGSDASQVSIETDVNGDYVIQLVVTDNLGLASEPVFVVVSTQNSAPVAEAGADQYFENPDIIIQLDGSQSFDPDGDPITYAWTIASKPIDSLAQLSNPNDVQPTFVADTVGDYIIELVVTDDLGTMSVPDEVVVSSGNVKPVADAGGNQLAIVDHLVLLDGSSSYDANNDPLTYSWAMVSKPKASLATLSDSLAVDPDFVPDIDGWYLISLVVNDGELDSDPDNATILAIDANNIDEFVQALWDAINAINLIVKEDINNINNYNNRNALTNKILSVIFNYVKGEYDQQMLNKLTDDIAGKFDGCALDEPPAVDQNDWIMNCDAQDLVYPHLELAITILDGMLSAP